MQQYDFQSYDQISTILRLLMHSVQQKTPQVPQMRSHSAGGGPNMGQGGFQQHGGQHYNQRNNNFQNRGGQNFRGNNNMPNQMRNQEHQQQHMRQQQPMPNPNPMPSAMPMPQPAPMPNPGQPVAQNMPAPMQQIQFTPSNDPMAAEFYSKTMPIYAAITEINPSYKQTVGSTIFEFVTKLVGPQFAPKITGMLIDLPIVEVQRYVTNYDLMFQRVRQAQDLLQKQANEGQH